MKANVLLRQDGMTGLIDKTSALAFDPLSKLGDKIKLTGCKGNANVKASNVVVEVVADDVFQHIVKGAK